VVEAKHSYRWVDPVISQNATVREAIVSTIEGGLSGMMVLGEGNHVVGLLTSRDLLRIIASGIVEEESNDQVLQKVVKDHMTPISQVIYARPDETVGMCRTIMAKLGIKCLPILAKDGRVAGVITAKDISNFGLTAKDRGGKESYLNNVAQRVGLSINTRYVAAHTSHTHDFLFVKPAPPVLTPRPMHSIPAWQTLRRSCARVPPLNSRHSSSTSGRQCCRIRSKHTKRWAGIKEVRRPAREAARAVDLDLGQRGI
jgi:CBS domain-containing protein